MIRNVQKSQTPDVRGAKLPNTTPIFGGENNKMNVNDWLFIIENQLVLSQVPKNIWCNALTPFVRKTAFEMLKKHIQTGGSYDSFKKNLINTFLPVNHERTVRSQLLNLRHTESFDKYSKTFQYLSSQLSSMSEEDKLVCFVNGLRQHTRIEVELRKPNTLEMAINIASIIELAREESVKVNALNIYPNKNRNNPNSQKQNKEIKYTTFPEKNSKS